MRRRTCRRHDPRVRTLGEKVGELSPQIRLDGDQTEGGGVLEACPGELDGLVNEIDRGRALGLFEAGGRAAASEIRLYCPNRAETFVRQIRDVVRRCSQADFRRVHTRHSNTEGVHQDGNRQPPRMS